ncbi:MAG TPA: serine hydrolase domain-containing protein, partial [Gemmatimonadaceae bacterium]|nr:serine hydrolase domain-containing protein [Gemmatimonadaceae bacterium]
MTPWPLAFSRLLVAAFLVAAPAIAAQGPTLDTVSIAAALEAEQRSMRSPGAAIAVVVGDRIVYDRGFGTTSVERDDPVTPETLFRVGSVTKMFTGLTAVSLARAGVVDLRAPLGTYVAGLHEVLRGLTLHDLLSHMAGVTSEGADTGPHDDRALGERVRQWGAEHVFAPAGDVYSYTGPGYWLAGHALEQAGKGWYADLVARHVLEPLGMRRSTFRPTMAMTWPMALDHRVQGERVTVLRPAPDDASTWPSGSLYSSARELARFAIAFMNGGMLDGRQVLDPEAITVMTTRHGGLPGEA